MLCNNGTNFVVYLSWFDIPNISNWDFNHLLRGDPLLYPIHLLHWANQYKWERKKSWYYQTYFHIEHIKQHEIWPHSNFDVTRSEWVWGYDFRLLMWYRLIPGYELMTRTCRKVSNIRRTKSRNFNDSRLVLQLSLSNLLEPGVKSRMKMYLEQRRQDFGIGNYLPRWNMAAHNLSTWWLTWTTNIHG